MQANLTRLLGILMIMDKITKNQLQFIFFQAKLKVGVIGEQPIGDHFVRCVQ